ncbi:MAG: Na(+)/H(+) antiporter subunit D [Gemmatimonadetes bacterium]|nr:Na(+)/H(+) antiporter subunit D [Gemmatimonadota bacterium]
MSNLHPALVFFAGALLVAMLRGRTQALAALLVPVVSAWSAFQLAPGTEISISIFQYELLPFRVDKLSLLFSHLFHIAAFLTLLFAWEAGDRLQRVTGLLYAGSALLALFAGDLITLFIAWELLAVTSVFLIWARGTERANRSGMRYLIIQISSGVILLAGAIIYFRETGSLAFGEIGTVTLGGKLILLAFGIKAAFPFLHAWMIDAYPEATPAGAVFLSSFTTKTAIYALARAFAGEEILIFIGVVMAALPIFFAVIENDLRRVLAYSLNNQLGFMVVGVGIGTPLALNGTVAHAFCHVLYKSLLFMSMGAVLYRVGHVRGSDLGGLYKSMPFTAVFCIIGAASISAFPLFSGFVSKSLIVAAVLHEHHIFVWMVLLFASAGVFHHAGIKVPFFAFFSHDSGIRVKEAPKSMLLAMGIGSALCIGLGCFPQFLYALLPWPVDYTPYTGTHVLTQTQLLFFSALAFTWLKLTHLYPPELRAVHLDADWIYRRALPATARGVAMLAERVRLFGEGIAHSFVSGLQQAGRHHLGPDGIFGRTWATGSIAVWVAILLVIYLIFEYGA